VSGCNVPEEEIESFIDRLISWLVQPLRYDRTAQQALSKTMLTNFHAPLQGLLSIWREER